MLSPGLIKVPAGIHPDHGEPVDYQPGQLLPVWLSELFERDAASLRVTDVPGVYELYVSRSKGRRHTKEKP
jgi:hypothetical protein